MAPEIVGHLYYSELLDATMLEIIGTKQISGIRNKDEKRILVPTVVPEIYLSRLPFGMYSRQSNLCLTSAITCLPSNLTIVHCVSAQYPRNRTMFLCFTRIRQATSCLNFSSSILIVCFSRLTATTPFASIPCS